MRGWSPFEAPADSGAAARSLSQSPPPSLAWHPHVQRCAASLGLNGVHIAEFFDFSDGGREGRSIRPLLTGKPLRHDLQQRVSCLAWQPCRGNTLAVGCRGGVCIWSTADERDVWRHSQDQTTRDEAADKMWLERNNGSARPRVLSARVATYSVCCAGSNQPFLLAPPVDTGTHDARWLGRPDASTPAAANSSGQGRVGSAEGLRVRQFLNTGTQNAEALNEASEGDVILDTARLSRPVTSSIAWSPDGQFLACCTETDPAVLLWEVATGRCTVLRCAFDNVDRGYSLLAWSPDGKFLFAASVANRFRIWCALNWCVVPLGLRLPRCSVCTVKLQILTSVISCCHPSQVVYGLERACMRTFCMLEPHQRRRYLFTLRGAQFVQFGTGVQLGPRSRFRRHAPLARTG